MGAHVYPEVRSGLQVQVGAQVYPHGRCSSRWQSWNWKLGLPIWLTCVLELKLYSWTNIPKLTLPKLTLPSVTLPRVSPYVLHDLNKRIKSVGLQLECFSETSMCITHVLLSQPPKTPNIHNPSQSHPS